MHIGREFWNLENICKSTNNLSFLCQFFINEITVSDAGPDIIRSHLFFSVDLGHFVTVYFDREEFNYWICMFEFLHSHREFFTQMETFS